MATAAESIALGRKARDEGDLAAARACYAEAAAILRDQNDPLAYAHTIRHLADIDQQESNHVAAQPLYEEALAIYRSNLHTRLLDLANTVRPYALLHEHLGNVAEAREHWQEARNLYNSLRLREGVAECDAHLTRLPSA